MIRTPIALLSAFALVIVITVIATGLLHKQTASEIQNDDLFRDLGIEKITAEDLAPDFTLNDIGGKTVRLRDLKGKVVFLNFWATWCPPCVLEMPTMEKLHQQYGSKGLVILAINFRENPEDVKAFLQKHELTFTTLLDPGGKVLEQYEAWSLPTSVIINKSGQVVGKVIGYRDWHSAKARQFFERLLDEQLEAISAVIERPNSNMLGAALAPGKPQTGETSLSQKLRRLSRGKRRWQRPGRS